MQLTSVLLFVLFLVCHQALFNFPGNNSSLACTNVSQMFHKCFTNAQSLLLALRNAVSENPYVGWRCPRCFVSDVFSYTNTHSASSLLVGPPVSRTAVTYIKAPFSMCLYSDIGATPHISAWVYK